MKRRPTRWPNVYRYPDDTYYAFVKPIHGGNAKEVSLRTKKASQVPDALKIAEMKVQRSFFAGSRLSFGETIDDYVKERAREWKPRTLAEAKKIIEGHLKPFFGKYKIVEIDHNLWDSYVKKKVVGDYMNHRSILVNFITWAMYKNWLQARPMVFKLPKHRRRSRRILKPEEIKAVISNCKGKLEIFVHLCLFHGMRGNEATVRRYSEIDMRNAFLTITDSKTNLPRTVPLLTFTMALILRDSKGSKSPYLFPKRARAREHASSGWFRKAWVKMLKDAKLVDEKGEPEDITPHDLRATGEKYAAKLTKFTRTEREKMFGSRVEVQDSTYITEFFVDELRGLESAMLDTDKGVDGLEKILQSRALALGGIWDDKDNNEATH